MLRERADYAEQSYKCSRCGGIFGSYSEETVKCPFCAMLCDEGKCRIVEEDTDLF